VDVDETGQLLSSLWVDQPDAHDGVARRLEQGTIDADRAAQLTQFIDEGYTSLHVDLDAYDISADDEYERLWDERPAHLAIATGGQRISMAEAQLGDRQLGYRLPDVHGFSELFSALYLHPEVMGLMEQILDDKAMAFQSLLFEWGSQQGLHRDPMFVKTTPASELTAAWIALEDVHDDAGPLLYVPGSHRMPWFQPEPGSVVFPQAERKKIRTDWAAHRAAQLEELGLEVQRFTCKRGDVFIWHAGLLHGGAHLDRPEATRKSLVTHYSRASNYTSRTARLKVRDETSGDERWVTRKGSTDVVLEAHGFMGLDAPLKQARL